MMSDDHMMHGSWDIKRDRQFFVILDQFLPSPPPPPPPPPNPPNNPKNWNFEKMEKKQKKTKKTLETSSFYKSAS